MKLTDYEKLSLLLQCDAVEGEDNMEVDFVRSAISSGNTWAFAWKYSHLEFEDTDPEHVKFVTDVLDMFGMLESAYERLNKSDKKLVDAEGSVKYQGFDGNNESEYLSAVRFFVVKLDRWTEFTGRESMNSHGRNVPGYKRMLAAYKSVGDFSSGKMTPEQLIKVIQAFNHPKP